MGFMFRSVARTDSPGAGLGDRAPGSVATPSPASCLRSPPALPAPPSTMPALAGSTQAGPTRSLPSAACGRFLRGSASCRGRSLDLPGIATRTGVLGESSASPEFEYSVPAIHQTAVGHEDRPPHLVLSARGVRSGICPLPTRPSAMPALAGLRVPGRQSDIASLSTTGGDVRRGAPTPCSRGRTMTTHPAPPTRNDPPKCPFLVSVPFSTRGTSGLPDDPPGYSPQHPGTGVGRAEPKQSCGSPPRGHPTVRGPCWWKGVKTGRVNARVLCKHAWRIPSCAWEPPRPRTAGSRT